MTHSSPKTADGLYVNVGGIVHVNIVVFLVRDLCTEYSRHSKDLVRFHLFQKCIEQKFNTETISGMIVNSLEPVMPTAIAAHMDMRSSMERREGSREGGSSSLIVQIVPFRREAR